MQEESGEMSRERRPRAPPELDKVGKWLLHESLRKDPALPTR